MNFECIQLTINDYPDFGCTIEFCDTVEEYDGSLPMEEQLKRTGKYLLIERSYPEDIDENDWYTIETSEAKIEFSQRDKMYVKLSQKKFEIHCAGETVVIGLNLSDNEHSGLRKILRKRFRKMVVMLKDDLS